MRHAGDRRQRQWPLDLSPAAVRHGRGDRHTMTVIRLSDRSLLVHSPIRLTPALEQKLASLGRVEHADHRGPGFQHQCGRRLGLEADVEAQRLVPDLRAVARVPRAHHRAPHGPFRRRRDPGAEAGARDRRSWRYLVRRRCRCRRARLLVAALVGGGAAAGAWRGQHDVVQGLAHSERDDQARGSRKRRDDPHRWG